MCQRTVYLEFHGQLNIPATYNREFKPIGGILNSDMRNVQACAIFPLRPFPLITEQYGQMLHVTVHLVKKSLAVVSKQQGNFNLRAHKWLKNGHKHMNPIYKNR